jgi:hypothetical protein
MPIHTACLRPFRLLSVLLLGLSLLLVGCDTTSSQTTPKALKGNFVGRVFGSNAFLALTTSDNKASAYACDGQTIAEWFSGDVRQGAFSDTSIGGAQLQATITREGVDGRLTLPGGQPLSFHLEPATGDAGLYVAQQTINGTAYLGGWDVLLSGEQHGAVKANGVIVATTPLDVHQATVTVPGVGTLSPQHADGFIEKIGSQ